MSENKETIEEIKSPGDLVETLVSGLSQEEYDKIRDNAIEEAKTKQHAWVMKGRGKLVCTSCDYPHVSYIPMNKTQVGIDDQGKPILNDI